MATAEEIEAARERIADAQAELTLEKERLVVAAREPESDATLALLLAEEARLLAEAASVRADADHQERAVGILDADPPVTPVVVPVDTQSSFSFGNEGNLGDDVTGRE